MKTQLVKNKLQQFNSEHICSLGIRCIPSQVMVQLNIKEESLPFDWTQSNPQIIIDCLKNNFKDYNDFEYTTVSNLYDLDIRYSKLTALHPNLKKSEYNGFINKYGMIFTHYTHYKKNEFKDMCKRRCERFMNILKSNKKILFVYMADTNLERIQEQEKQYNYLLDLEKYFIKEYPLLQFKILCIQNIKREDTDNILNLHNNNNSKMENKKWGVNYDNTMYNLCKELFDYIPKKKTKAKFE